jgi:hypothetical protein
MMSRAEGRLAAIGETGKKKRLVSDLWWTLRHHESARSRQGGLLTEENVLTDKLQQATLAYLVVPYSKLSSIFSSHASVPPLTARRHPAQDQPKESVRSSEVRDHSVGKESFGAERSENAEIRCAKNGS